MLHTSRRRLLVASRRSVRQSLAVRNYHIVFFGSDEVSLQTLRALHGSRQGGGGSGLVTSLSVVCPSDRRTGRGLASNALPVKRFCVEEGIALSEVPNGVRDLTTLPELLDTAAATTSASGTQNAPASPGFVADLGVVVSFGYFIPPIILSRLRLGAINMHPSLLPKYRGAAPIPHAILAGERKTGVSLIEIHPQRFDSGAILRQVEVAVEDSEGSAALTARLAVLGAETVMAGIAGIEACRRVARTQEHMIQELRAANPDLVLPRAPKLHPIQGLLTWPHADALAPAAPAVTHTTPSDIHQKHQHTPVPPVAGKTAPATPAPASSADLTVERVLRMGRAFDDSIHLHSHFTPEPWAEGTEGLGHASSAHDSSHSGAADSRAERHVADPVPLSEHGDGCDGRRAVASKPAARIRLLAVRRCTPAELSILAQQAVKHGFTDDSLPSAAATEPRGVLPLQPRSPAPGCLAHVKVPVPPPSAPLGPDAGGASAKPKLHAQNALFLRLVDGWVALDSVQLEMKKAQAGGTFSQGYHIGFCTHRLVNPPPTVTAAEP